MHKLLITDYSLVLPTNDLLNLLIGFMETEYESFETRRLQKVRQ